MMKQLLPDRLPNGETFLRNRLRGAVLVLFLSALLSAPSLIAAPPIVTIIDDDAKSERAIEAVKAVADRCRIKVTFAVIALHLERNPNIADRLRRYVEEGHEIASHSLTHSPRIWKAGAATDIRAVERDVAEAEKIFRHLGLRPRSFVYPYGRFHANVRHGIFAVVGKYYPVAFNARGDINLPGKTYPLYVSRHPLRSHNSMFMTKRLIDKAVAEGDAWIVILTHSGESDFSAEMLEKTIRYAQKSGAVFLPASAAWRQIESWPMMREERIPEYSRLDDYANAAYFHLPQIAAAGIAVMLLCGGTVYVLVRLRRKKSDADK